MKVDVYGHEARFKKWKEEVLLEGERGLTKANSDILIEFILDMEIGRNVSRQSKRGPRSFIRFVILHS